MDTLTPQPSDIAISPFVDLALSRLGVDVGLGSLKQILNTEALFRRHLFASDSVVLHNEWLRDLAGAPEFVDLGYQRLLTDGILVPTLRASSFVSAGESLLGPHMHRTRVKQLEIEGLSREDAETKAAEEDLQHLYHLDAWCRYHVPITLEGSSNLFTAAVDAYLTSPSLVEHVGGKSRADWCRRWLNTARKVRTPDVPEGNLTRSHLFTLADEYEKTYHHGASYPGMQKLREYVSVLYHGASSEALNTRPVFQAELQRHDRSVDRAYGVTVAMPDVALTRAQTARKTPAQDLIDTRVIELSGDLLADIADVDFHVIAELRRKSAWQTYIDAYHNAIQADSIPDSFVDAFASYLDFVSEELRYALTGTARDYAVLKQRKTYVFLGSTTVNLACIGIGYAADPLVGVGLGLTTLFGSLWLSREMSDEERSLNQRVRHALEVARLQRKLAGGSAV